MALAVGGGPVQLFFLIWELAEVFGRKNMFLQAAKLCERSSLVKFCVYGMALLKGKRLCLEELC